MTSEEKIIASSPDMNITARSLTAMGNTGTIGGDQVTFYSQNIFGKSSTFTNGVTAPTFHGDLQGTATSAIDANQSAKADVANSLGSGAGTGGHSAVNTATDTVQTTQPTLAIVNAGLTNPEYGIREIEVDTFDDLKFTVNRSRNYGGISVNDLTTKSARSKLRDPNTIANETFVGELISDGTVSKDFANTIPPKFGKVVNANDKAQRGTEAIGPSNPKGKVFQT